eukprot:gene13927-16464_t
MTQDMAIQAQKLSEMLSLVLGYLQVMSQLTGIRERDLASTSIDPGYQF